MPTCQRTSVIDADYETVWEFYDDPGELELLTPDWMGLRVSDAVGPDGQRNPEGYLPGTELRLELQPLGFGPTGEWVVQITDRNVDGSRATFVDEQVGDLGPYDEWCHTHRFADLGDATMLHDRIEYRVPGAGALPLATPFLAGMLWYRHRRTRTFLAD